MGQTRPSRSLTRACRTAGTCATLGTC
ncbi:hypothetical protein HaLaN_28591, partial [Haematococcus lacustris]